MLGGGGSSIIVLLLRSCMVLCDFVKEEGDSKREWECVIMMWNGNEINIYFSFHSVSLAVEQSRMLGTSNSWSRL